MSFLIKINFKLLNSKTHNNYLYNILLVISIVIISSFATVNKSVASNYEYYVDSNKGSLSNPGTIKKPFLSIQQAVNAANYNSTINIKSGVYKESITVSSRNNKNYITLKGDVDEQGEPAVIIDTSERIIGWIPAYEVGENVYKAKIEFEPGVITVNNKKIGIINHQIMNSREGFKILNYSADKVVKIKNSEKDVFFWDGVEVISGYLNNFVYIRFKNENNPNKEYIKASLKGASLILNNSNSNKILNIRFENSQYGVIIEGEKSYFNTIKNCVFINQKNKILVHREASNNIIMNNVLLTNYYVKNVFGAGNLKQYDGIIRRHVYDFFKYVVGIDRSDDCGVRFENAGSSNMVHDNKIFDGLIGISSKITKDAPITTNLVVENNEIYNMGSAGVVIGRGLSNGVYKNNKLYNCNISIRVHEVNSIDDSQRRIYIYDNLLWNYENNGSHIYFHASSKLNNKSYPKIYIFNNIIIGAKEALNCSNMLYMSGGLLNTYFFNNYISSKTIYENKFSKIVKSNQVGLFLLNNDNKHSDFKFN